MFYKLNFIFLVSVIATFYKEAASVTDAPCRENRSDTCIENLATFISLDTPRFVTERELEKLCREAEDGQRCSSDFLRASTCVSSEAKREISLKVGRSQAVSQLLCKSGNYIPDPEFRTEYLKNSPCIEDHFSKIRDCFIAANVPENPELEVVINKTKSADTEFIKSCCPMMRYIECSEDVIGPSCGSQSKHVVSTLLMKAAGRSLKVFCSSVDATYPKLSAVCINSASCHKLSALALILLGISLYLCSIKNRFEFLS